MILHFTSNFKKKVAKLTQNNSQLQKRISKQFQLFQKNPYYIGLRLHKLKGERAEQYAMWIIDDLRALAIKDGEVYTFFDIVTHDEY